MSIFKQVLFLFVLVFTITSIHGSCRKSEPSPCANGEQPLAGYFCGRGPTRVDCPSTHECIIAPNDAYAVCCPRKSEPSPCANGEKPLAGYFCGRGPTRVDCPSTHECIIAPNDAYAVCCPRDGTPVTEPTKNKEKPGYCPPPSGMIGICIARCSTDDECKGNQKCCGSCPRECVDPILPVD